MGAGPPPEVTTAFAGVDLILHAGDIYTSECLDHLEQIAPVLAVEIPPAPVDGDPRVEYKRVLHLEGYSVGLVHDLNVRGIDEFLPGLAKKHFIEEGSLSASLAQFFGEKIDVAVFGHTHFEMAEHHQGILLVNPGSPTLPHQSKRLGNVAILELSPEETRAEIINLVTLRDA